MSLTRRLFLKQASAAGAVFALGIKAPQSISDPSSSYGTGIYGSAVYGGVTLRRKHGRH